MRFGSSTSAAGARYTSATTVQAVAAETRRFNLRLGITVTTADAEDSRPETDRARRRAAGAPARPTRRARPARHRPPRWTLRSGPPPAPASSAARPGDRGP